MKRSILSLALTESRIYLLLILIRLLVALTSTSIIHPDEHFQNTEIAASDFFTYRNLNDGPLRTWEWQGRPLSSTSPSMTSSSFAPVRSIIPVWLSTGIWFWLVRYICPTEPSVRLLFLVQRAGMWVMSLIIDLCLWNLTKSRMVLLLFASSPINFTFLQRPFSNSLETVLLAILMYSIRRFEQSIREDRRSSMFWAIVISVITALGVWTRITFIAFALPLFVGLASLLFVRQRYYTLFGFASIGAFVLGGCVVAFSIIDTLYFEKERTLVNVLRAFPQSLIITPWEFFNFNRVSTHLAEHGLHPRWLHVIVNLPMLFGIGLWPVLECINWLWRTSITESTVEMKEKGREANRVASSMMPIHPTIALSASLATSTLVACVIVPTFILSIQPHQEPRFILPLVVPVVMLIPRGSFFRVATRAARWKRTVVAATWILHTVLLTVVFGYLHQGGLIPALWHINKLVSDPTVFSSLSLSSSESNSSVQGVHLVFWRTFMPPRHLLTTPTSSSSSFNPLQARPFIRITDLAGANVTILEETLLALEMETEQSESSPLHSTVTVLVAPAWVYDDMIQFPSCSLAPSKMEKMNRFSFLSKLPSLPSFLYSSSPSSQSPLQSICIEPLLKDSIGVHLDMDHLATFIQAPWDRWGVGLWRVGSLERETVA